MIGLSIGLVVTQVGIPSFVVTLAYFLALQGVMLAIIGAGGTVPIHNSQILAINNNNLPCVGRLGVVHRLCGRLCPAGLPAHPEPSA